jgi:hypothetical protein
VTGGTHVVVVGPVGGRVVAADIGQDLEGGLLAEDHVVNQTPQPINFGIAAILGGQCYDFEISSVTLYLLLPTYRYYLKSNSYKKSS